jgi:hypothetical protein
MRKAVASAVAGSALLFALSLALAQPDGLRPEGVAANSWIALTADVGFVVTGNNSQMVRLGADRPSVTGYLMARRNGTWVRLEPEGAGRVLPTN